MSDVRASLYNMYWIMGSRRALHDEKSHQIQKNRKHQSSLKYYSILIQVNLLLRQLLSEIAQKCAILSYVFPGKG